MKKAINKDKSMCELSDDDVEQVVGGASVDFHHRALICPSYKKSAVTVCPTTALDVNYF